MYDEFPSCPRCGNDNPSDGVICGKCRQEVDAPSPAHAERLRMRFRDHEAEDYENCTPLNPAQLRAKELIEAELAPLMATLPVYADGTW